MFLWKPEVPAQCSLYIFHSTSYTPHFPLHIFHSTFYTPHFTLLISTPHFTLYILHSTLHTVHHQPYDLTVDSPDVTLADGRSHNLKVPEGPDPQS